MRYSPTERIGIAQVEGITAQDLGWIFREQPILDMGVDAQIEFVDDNQNPTGKLIALQIKTGASHFTRGDSGYTYYGNNTHLEYWTGHSLPVLLIGHIPETKQTFWQVITQKTITKTAKHWKVLIPYSNIYGADCKNELERFFEGTPSQQKLRALTLDLPLMQHIESGKKVSVGLEHWYNKSLGRSPIEVFVYDEHNDEQTYREWHVFYTARSIKSLANILFPWANVIIDQDFYDENEEFEEDDRDRLMRATDLDHGFEPYIPSPSDIYPYADNAGEVESYRLQLVLNDLGKSFLKITEYIEDE
ncbi:DUF4365 domain-containing protein [Pseudomonas sp. NPDC087346]|jgi:hypothetical protein|uniref:DUF4365 domain-containing protein n=1 Tax=unclassified Pseudomonas TaxID=196821 RepID=UPI0037835178